MLTERDLRTRIGPLLSDGTAVRDLIDFDRHEVSMRVMNDPELHRQEMRRIFARSWIGLGHVSEIPNPGDFVLRYMGQDPVIVTRDQEGGVNVLLNVCAHRGMEVCWADEGNASSFKCPYHGWVYGCDGKLLGAPFEKEMYGDWDKSQYGLRKAKAETRHGIIFGNFDDSAVPLDEWMGDLAWYFDCIYEGAANYEVLAPPARWVARANWKTIIDQNAGDLYHIAGTHKAVVELGFMPNIECQLDVVKIGFPGLGHNVFGLNPMRQNAMGGMEVLPEDEKYAFEGRGFIDFIFPVTTGGGGRGMALPDGSTVGTAQLNCYMPKGHGTFEVWQLSLVQKDVPDFVKETIRKSQMITVSLLQDDADAVQSIQHAATGVMGQEQMMKYNAQFGPNRPEAWPGPGEVYAGFSHDDTQWDFWQRWFDMMTADEA